jgi:hypothetical protein
MFVAYLLANYLYFLSFWLCQSVQTSASLLKLTKTTSADRIRRAAARWPGEPDHDANFVLPLTQTD